MNGVGIGKKECVAAPFDQKSGGRQKIALGFWEVEAKIET